MYFCFLFRNYIKVFRIFLLYLFKFNFNFLFLIWYFNIKFGQLFIQIINLMLFLRNLVNDIFGCQYIDIWLWQHLNGIQCILNEIKQEVEVIVNYHFLNETVFFLFQFLNSFLLRIPIWKSWFCQFWDKFITKLCT